MSKNKSSTNKLETVEKYFNTENDHYNEHTFALYQEAQEKKLFKDLEIPLRLFSDYEDIFVTNRTKFLQVSKQFVEVMEKEKLSNKQQVFILEHLISWFTGTTFSDDDGKTYSVKNIADHLENECERLLPSQKQSSTDNPFDWGKVKQHLTTLQDAAEKIAYLIIKKTEYKQQDLGEFIFGVTFDQQCELEIKKIEALRKLEPKTPSPAKTQAQFKLSNRKGTKTNLIRILNAIYELRMIEKKDGQIPSKESFMKEAGEFFGTDFSKYDIDLSQAMNNTSIEANLKIFEDMKTIIQNKVLGDNKK